MLQTPRPHDRRAERAPREPPRCQEAVFTYTANYLRYLRVSSAINSRETSVGCSAVIRCPFTTTDSTSNWE